MVLAFIFKKRNLLVLHGTISVSSILSLKPVKICRCSPEVDLKIVIQKGCGNIRRVVYHVLDGHLVFDVFMWTAIIQNIIFLHHFLPPERTGEKWDNKTQFYIVFQCWAYSYKKVLISFCNILSIGKVLCAEGMVA